MLDHLDSSPSPWHAAQTAADRLGAAGFSELAETEPWASPPSAGFTRRGAALVAWRLADGRPNAVRIVGAHTDSPCLRVHPHADQSVANSVRLWITTNLRGYVRAEDLAVVID